MEVLNLITVDRSGKANVYHVNEINKAKLKSILSDENLLSEVEQIKANRIEKYNPRGIKVDLNHLNTTTLFLKNKYNTIDIGVGGVTRSVTSALSIVPKCFSGFWLEPKHLAKLNRLHIEPLDLEAYTKWFFKNKMGKTVHSFSMNIFLYNGILDEFRAIAKKQKKVDKYKKSSSKWDHMDSKSKETVKKFEEKYNEK